VTSASDFMTAESSTPTFVGTTSTTGLWVDSTSDMKPTDRNISFVKATTDLI